MVEKSKERIEAMAPIRKETNSVSLKEQMELGKKMKELVMPEIRSFDLRNEIPGDGLIKFLRTEIPATKFRTRFVLIRYAIGGVEQQGALRFDLDKQAFIDHFEDREKEEILQKAAPALMNFFRKVFSCTT